MANKIFLVLLLVAPLVVSTHAAICSPGLFTNYNVRVCLPDGLEYFPTDVPVRTFGLPPPGWMASWKISSGLLSALPVWTNEELTPAVAGEWINFGLSQCLTSTKKAAVVSGGCVCDVNNDLVISKPAFLNITDATVVSCGIGALRLGVRPVPCNSWLCGCVDPGRAGGNDALPVVSQAYCS